jgi:hypothetical protein
MHIVSLDRRATILGYEQMSRGTVMPLDAEIRRYEEMRGELGRRYQGKYFVFRGQDFIGPYDNLAVAAVEATRWHAGPFLIRKVGVDELQELVGQITPENRHKETYWGKPKGKEVW